MNKWVIKLNNCYANVWWTKDGCWATNKDDAMQFNSKQQACQYAEKELSAIYASFIIERLES